MDNTKILLVDDEVEFTDILSQRMTARGLDVDVSPDGQDALDKAATSTYDAVVLDLAMPGMDGIETLKRLLAGNPDLQVILLTGHATLEKGIEAVKSGAMEFLEKPVDINRLLEIIERAKSVTDRLTTERIEDSLKDILKSKGW